MVRFKQSGVVFNEEDHTYYLGKKRLLGITGLIHAILGLGVYPEASQYVKDVLIPRAGRRGTAVHHAIQTYDQLGVKQTRQCVEPFGWMSESGEEVGEWWDVSNELESYIRHLEGFEPLANELTVSDGKWASQIDNVWRRKSDGSIWLVDTKTNNLDRYPLCGYFDNDYFTDRKEALKEYLSWQLSIYECLFEDMNPDYNVAGLACNWLRPDEAELFEIERKPRELVRDLLTTEYIFSDDGPVYFHPDPAKFKGAKNLPSIPDEALMITTPDVITYVADLMKKAADINTRLDEAKKTLRAAMEKYNVKSFDFGEFKATIAADSQKRKFNTNQFKKDHPDLYDEYTSTSFSKGGLTLK